MKILFNRLTPPPDSTMLFHLGWTNSGNHTTSTTVSLHMPYVLPLLLPFLSSHHDAHISAVFALVSAIDMGEDATRRWQIKHGFLFAFTIATNITVTSMSGVTHLCVFSASLTDRSPLM